MTSAEFASVPLDSVIVNRDERQRRELRDIDSLADSINNIGLINPIVITRDHILVAGERRLTACRNLGWSHIPAQFAEDLPADELHLIELEENTKRLDITWQEATKAVADYHSICAKTKPDWSATKTASYLGMNNNAVSRYLAVARNLDDESIRTAPAFSTAFALVSRKEARAKADTLKNVERTVARAASPTPITPSEEATPEPSEAPFINANCMEWAADYTGPLFNFLHCDFPYGIGANTAPRTEASAYNTTAAVHLGGYDDSAETYFKLIEGLPSLPVAETAHMMFWFSMRFYEDTLAALRGQGWTVDPFPLIWHKTDNVGVLPDPQRGGRRTYEVAFHCYRGDAKIAKAVAMSYAGPSGRADRIHMSEKPRPMLEHFFRMYVDEYTSLLDPTAGSGNAIHVASALGARHFLGIELDPEFFSRAVDAWND